MVRSIGTMFSGTKSRLFDIVPKSHLWSTDAAASHRLNVLCTRYAAVIAVEKLRQEHGDYILRLKGRGSVRDGGAVSPLRRG